MGEHNNQINNNPYKVTIHVNDGEVEHTIGEINIDPSKKGAFFNDCIGEHFYNIGIKKMGGGEQEISITPKDKNLSVDTFINNMLKYISNCPCGESNCPCGESKYNTSNEENMTDKIKKSLKTAKGYNVDWGNFDGTKVKTSECGELIPQNKEKYAPRRQDQIIVDANDLFPIKKTQKELMETGAIEYLENIRSK